VPGSLVGVNVQIGGLDRRTNPSLGDRRRAEGSEHAMATAPEKSGGLVVVGVSKSLAGLAALRHAALEASLRGGCLYAVRVWQFRPPWRGPEVARYRADFADEASRYVHSAFDLAMGGLPTGVRTAVVAPDGRTDQVLMRLAGDRHDLLVLGAPVGRRPGRVVRNCLRDAACPVVVVHPPHLVGADDRVPVRRLLREIARYKTDAGPYPTPR
jgi:hypothetical protein